MAFGDHLIVDFSIYQSTNPEPFTTRMWYQVGGSSPQIGTMDTYANELHEYFAVVAAATLQENSIFGNLKTRWQLDTEEHFQWSSNAGVEGTVSTSEILPEEDCVIFRKYTGDNARNRRGRMFWPLVPETFSNSGRLTAGAVTAYQALIAKLRTQPTGDSIDGDGIILTPAQPDFKTATLRPITTWALVIDVHNRRDRRSPRSSLVVGST